MSWMLNNLLDGIEDRVADYSDLGGDVVLPSSAVPARWSVDAVCGVGKLVWEPGNGTRYILLFQFMCGEEFCSEMGCGQEAFLVTWALPGERYASYPFRTDGYYAVVYVQEKLGGSEEDAFRIAIMLAEVLDGKCQKEQG